MHFKGEIINLAMCVFLKIKDIFFYSFCDESYFADGDKLLSNILLAKFFNFTPSNFAILQNNFHTQIFLFFSSCKFHV